MPLLDRLKSQMDRRSLRFVLTVAANQLALLARHGVRRIFYDDGIWIHQTTHGYFAYHHPYIRLDMVGLDTWARTVFLRNYQPKPGDVILDIGAGAGEEVLTFSRAVGQRGRVLCVEAHPRTFRCLQKLVEYNRLENVIPIHCAVSEPGCTETLIQDSSEYLRNRVGATKGFRVPARAIDSIIGEFGLTQIHFLKMNIEGAERLAIRGMTETIQRTRTLCICCHDFLADICGDDLLRTREVVTEFLRQNGMRVANECSTNSLPYVREQVWAYDEPCRRAETLQISEPSRF
jgi:FkbM family methyltransferase